MNYIIDFYKNLDAFNTILFWSVIVVIILLLIFSIILANKNRKLKEIIESNGINIDDDRELPIKKIIDDIPTIQEDTTKEKIEINDETKNIEVQIPNVIIDKTPSIITPKEDNEIPIVKKEENAFIAEEYVMDNNENTPKMPDIKKEPLQVNKEIIKNETNIEKTNIVSGPYQRNVLREMSLNQTSPIGIVKKNTVSIEELNKAKELQNSLNETRNENFNSIASRQSYQNNREVNSNAQLINEKERYLREVSNKLSEKSANDGFNRTEYELKQEEDAIISYEELMKKKDNIKMIDEEDAVISIGELMRRKKEKEKIYNITPEEEDNKFINELKNFRSDL